MTCTECQSVLMSQNIQKIRRVPTRHPVDWSRLVPNPASRYLFLRFAASASA